MNSALLFSGQGSQYVGMLQDLYDKYPEAKELIDSADKALGYKFSEICFDGPIEKLRETRYTQPAIFLHSAVVYNLIGSKLSFNAVAGHSVGEYAALYAAGVMKFEYALRLVALRGELMFNAGESLPGTMFAVLSLPDEKVIEVCEKLSDNPDGNVVVAANFNSPGQVVVSGSRDYLRDNVTAFKEAGTRIVKELNVSGAFHSPLMKPAQDELEKAINAINFENAKVPVYTNVYAKPVSEADQLKDALVKQLTSPVRWTQILENMKVDGIENFVELGPGKVLQGLVKRTLKEVEFSGFDTADDIQNVGN